jgi:hypothetical protein
MDTDRVLSFELQEEGVEPFVLAERIRDTLAMTVKEHGMQVGPYDPWDSEWYIPVTEGAHVFSIVLSMHPARSAKWHVYVDYAPASDADELVVQSRLKPIIHDTIAALPGVRNLQWHPGFGFLQDAPT